MRNNIIFGWDNALQGETYPKAHLCYQAAFAAIGDPRAETWTLEDTKSMQGTSPAEIWSNADLWGGRGEEAKQAFYAKFEELPVVPLREGAVALLDVLARSCYSIYVVSNKTQEILDYEVAELRASEFVEEAFGSEGVLTNRQNLLLQILDKAGIDSDEVTVIANAKYREAAEELGMEFIEANSETFRRLFSAEIKG